MEYGFFYQIVSRKEIVDLVKQIVDREIRPRAIDMDRSGKIPDELLQILVSSGVTSMAVPAAYGARASVSIHWDFCMRNWDGVAPAWPLYVQPMHWLPIRC